MTSPNSLGTIAPDITLTAADRDRLIDLANAALGRMPDVAPLLLDEADRATVAATPATVGLQAYVEYHDSETNRVQCIQIVYPHEADIAQWKVSVLTLVGAGLIGLSAGQSIQWPTRDGRERVLSVLRIGSAPLRKTPIRSEL